MDIIFYKSTNEVSSFPKSLTDGVTISGTLRSECDILNPVIEFTGIGVDIPYNYCYIPTFKRYYFITEARSIRNDILEISMHVDVLQSWANEILNTKALVLRNEDYEIRDRLIADEYLITYPTFTETIQDSLIMSSKNPLEPQSSSDSPYSGWWIELVVVSDGL